MGDGGVVPHGQGDCRRWRRPFRSTDHARAPATPHRDIAPLQPLPGDETNTTPLSSNPAARDLTYHRGGISKNASGAGMIHGVFHHRGGTIRRSSKVYSCRNHSMETSLRRNSSSCAVGHAIVRKPLPAPPRAPLGATPDRSRLGDKRLAERCNRGICCMSVRAHPTEPSISSSMSRFSSTAYSMGSCFTNGSRNPLTIIVDASSSLKPRLMR